MYDFLEYAIGWLHDITQEWYHHIDLELVGSIEVELGVTQFQELWLCETWVPILPKFNK